MQSISQLVVMNTLQYFSRKINFETADKPAVEAPLFEELSDSETTRIVGGASAFVSGGINVFAIKNYGDINLPIELISGI